MSDLPSDTEPSYKDDPVKADLNAARKPHGIEFLFSETAAIGPNLETTPPATDREMLNIILLELRALRADLGVPDYPRIP